VKQTHWVNGSLFFLIYRATYEWSTGMVYNRMSQQIILAILFCQICYRMWHCTCWMYMRQATLHGQLSSSTTVCCVVLCWHLDQRPASMHMERNIILSGSLLFIEEEAGVCSILCHSRCPPSMAGDTSSLDQQFNTKVTKMF
jgi:hypothetical protein